MQKPVAIKSYLKIIQLGKRSFHLRVEAKAFINFLIN